MAKTRINNSMDDRMSEPVRKEMGEFRGVMVDCAEKSAMPDHFSAVPHPDRPAMIIVDERTGRSATVSLYAYGAVREALNDLFA